MRRANIRLVVNNDGTEQRIEIARATKRLKVCESGKELMDTTSNAIFKNCSAAWFVFLLKNTTIKGFHQ